MNGKVSMLAQNSHVDDQIVACTNPIINVVETLRFKLPRNLTFSRWSRNLLPLNQYWETNTEFLIFRCLLEPDFNPLSVHSASR